MPGTGPTISLIVTKVHRRRIARSSSVIDALACPSTRCTALTLAPVTLLWGPQVSLSNGPGIIEQPLRREVDLVA